MRNVILSCFIIVIFFSACEDRENEDHVFQYIRLQGYVKDQSPYVAVKNAEVLSLVTKRSALTDTTGFFSLDSLTAGADTFRIVSGICDTQYIALTLSDKNETQEVTFFLDCRNENMNLYVGAYGGYDLFIVDTDTRSKTDSLHTLFDIEVLAVVPNSTKMYISSYTSGYTYGFDTKLKTFSSTSIPYGGISVSPFGDLILFTYDAIYLIDPVTDGKTFLDSISNISLRLFSPKSRLLYFSKFATQKLYTFDYVEKNLIDSITLIDQNSVSYVPSVGCITPDGRYIYATTSNGKLIKIDLIQKTVTPITAVNRNGSVAITPDGKYVFVTDPGGYAFFEPIPTGLISIVRTSDDQVDGYVDYGSGVITDWIIISPTGKYAYVSHWGSSVSVIDIFRRQIIKNFEFISVSALIIPITLGPKS